MVCVRALRVSPAAQEPEMESPDRSPQMDTDTQNYHPSVSESFMDEAEESVSSDCPWREASRLLAVAVGRDRYVHTVYIRVLSRK